ncbi:MAG: ACT domain-containing protein [Cyanobacteria bacterium SZAS-4]|nr:ACT domain-containing protein [Cyanobacteria bacterium SZAS-4]
MSKNVVLTGVGHDRVGIVAELAEILFEMGCNLLDSSMTLLRGEFAIILMIRQPDGQSLEQLKKRISEVETKLGLSIHVRELAEGEAEEIEDVGDPYIISVYGADKPGIVSGITRVLADLGANVTDVETKHTGERDGATVFLMVLEVTLPEKVSDAKLRATLEQASKRLNVNVSVQSLDVVQL